MYIYTYIRTYIYYICAYYTYTYIYIYIYTYIKQGIYFLTIYISVSSKPSLIYIKYI